MPLRVIFDANIFISYLLSPDPAGVIVTAVDAIWNIPMELVFPESLASELRTSVAHKAYLRERISLDDVEILIDELRAVAIAFDRVRVEVPQLLRDQKDEYLLAAAISSSADVIVSGDRALLDIREEVIHPRIVTPREFLETLRNLQS